MSKPTTPDNKHKPPAAPSRPQQQQQQLPAATLTYAQQRAGDMFPEYIAVTPPPFGSHDWRPKEWLKLNGTPEYNKAALKMMPPFGIFPEATEKFWSQDEDSGEWFIGKGDWSSWEAVKDGSEKQRRVWNEQHGMAAMECLRTAGKCQYVGHGAEGEDCGLGVECMFMHDYQMEFYLEVLKLKADEIRGMEWQFPLKEGEDWAMGVEMGTVESVNEVGDVVAFGGKDMPHPGMARLRDERNPHGWVGGYARPWIYRTFYPVRWNGDFKTKVLDYWARTIWNRLRAVPEELKAKYPTTKELYDGSKQEFQRAWRMQKVREKYAAEAEAKLASSA
ncbi:hypothetical protein LTR17_009304 [Elasticomyces elasticus]|nr:hypothetical protein LTR17_009304 [Elasticomyces elasticus]